MPTDRVTVHTETLQEELYWQGERILSYKIQFPRFGGERFGKAIHRMNTYYKLKALAQQQYCRTKLYRQAMEDAHYAQAQGYPVMEYQVVTEFAITYNKDCYTSLYFDQYTYTGGAHGATIRTSDTWGLRGARRVPLSYFVRVPDVQRYVTDEVVRQIAQNMQSGQPVYFDDYEKNVPDTLDLESYYLEKEGVAVYFQQYDIAPYSTGIPVFILRYNRTTVHRPRC